MKLPKLGGANSVTDPKRIKAQTESIRAKTFYTRQQRRHNAFVIINRTNGLFVNISIEGDTTKVKDVELKEASRFMFSSLSNVMGHILMAEPKLDLDHRLIYRDKGQLKVK